LNLIDAIIIYYEMSTQHKNDAISKVT